MAEISSAVFRRKSRKIYSLNLDEIQNLLTSDSDLDVLLAEARKFGVSIVAANQYLEQLPKNMRAAFQAVGTHIAFQLSSDDATAHANVLGGGRPLTELLKNLPKRNFIAKSGEYPWQQVAAPAVELPKIDHKALLERSRSNFARSRSDVEKEIQERRPKRSPNVKEALSDWE
jgi:hypothetical protein